MSVWKKSRSRVLPIAAAMALSSVFVVGGASAANAGFGHSVGGGVWNHFVDNNGKVNASEYHHNSADHRASVENPKYGLVRAYAGPKRWASAYQTATLSGNKAYWYKF